MLYYLNMNYELAKQLKDAGFPQDGDNMELCHGESETVFVSDIEDGKTNYCYVPTLSELIEACGDRFGALHAMGTLVGEKGITSWKAESGGDHSIEDTFPFVNGKGETPEEAVAKLWLELNK